MSKQIERASLLSGRIRQYVLDLMEDELRTNPGRKWDRYDKAQFIKAVRACLDKDVSEACTIVYHRHVTNSQ